MKRRDFLKYTSLLAAGSLYPRVFAQALAPSRRRLILIELKGGNDGLNTLVPFQSRDYQRIRTKLHLKPEEVKIVDQRLGLGLNKSLEFLHSEFESQKVAIFHSVGYANPNMSHFRGIDIWETAVESGTSSSEGWIARALKNTIGRDAISKGIILGDYNLGALRGTQQKIMVVDNIRKMLNSRKLFAEHQIRGNEALKHILMVENQVLAQLEGLKGVSFEPKKKNGLEADVDILLQLVKADPNIPFFKLTLGGFDTHTNQKQRHAKLLGTLDNGLRDLVTGLKTLDAYDETLILTYSEFGRRPMENGNQGTDHGTANCHFAIGGRVRGKIYHGKDGLGDGGKPGQGGYELDSIKDTSQVLVSKMDFKDIYETVLTRWWGTGGLEGKRLAINFL